MKAFVQNSEKSRCFTKPKLIGPIFSREHKEDRQMARATGPTQREQSILRFFLFPFDIPKNSKYYPLYMCGL